MLSVHAAWYAIDHVATQLMAPPDPGGGKPPPGSFQGKFLTMLSWVAWTVFALCVAGILIIAGRMAVMHRRGEGGEHMAGLAWVGFAILLAGSASAIVGALV